MVIKVAIIWEKIILIPYDNPYLEGSEGEKKSKRTPEEFYRDVLVWWLAEFDCIKKSLKFSGKALRTKRQFYISVDVAAFETTILGKELPESMAKKIIEFNTDIKNNQEAEITNDLEMKLGCKPCCNR